MAAAASAHVFGVDPWGLPGQTAYRGRPRKQAKFVQDTNYQVAMGAIRRAGLQDRATLVRGFSTDVAAKWADPRPIGLLYIDGDHRADAAYGDLIAWRPFLAPEAVVAWDDYWPAHPGVVEAVDQLVAEGILTDLRVEARRLAVTRLAP
jgi:predicted O-methyltransferase YrrM